MHCPSCHAVDTKVVDSRLADHGSSTRRRRQCTDCGFRFTTFERMEEIALLVVKSHGGREPFDREKVRRGLIAAGKGRIDLDEIEHLVDRVEDRARLGGGEVTSAEVGLSVLDGLRSLDEVAYLRFASVYKNFDAASDFERELVELSKLSAVERSG